MNPTFSIIVPVYNVEDYLDECLNCLLAQSFHDFEVILINDGSTDNSEAICQEFTNKDPRFLLRTTHNQGQGAARNIGITLAKGQYIYFYDSDDKLSDNLLEKLHNIHTDKNVDIVMFEGDVFGDISTNTFEYKRANNHTNIQLTNYIHNSLIDQSFTPSPCLYSFRKDAVSNLHFLEGIIYEDLAFYLNLTLDHKLSFFVLKEALFHRRVRQNSTMTTAIKEKNAIAALTVFNHISQGTMSETKQLFLKLYYNNVVSFVALAFKWGVPLKYRISLIKCFFILIKQKQVSVKGLIGTIFPELKKFTKS
ncbi:glycosyltransferase [bacterium]|nr:glycosyltransferase [bacterium]